MALLITHRAVSFVGVFALVIVLAVLLLAASSRASSMMFQCRFDPDGYFYVKGGAPRGFEELGHLHLVTDRSGRPTTSESHLYANDGTSYRLASLGEFQTHSSGNGITFEFMTGPGKGVNYQFSGKFTSYCVLAQTERDPEKVVAVGTLVKFEKGKKKEAAEVELTYSKSLRQQTAREVMAVVTKIELKAYTDHLENGNVLVSDLIHFEVVEPKELQRVSVTAYYQGAPTIQTRRLQVGDFVRFELPSEVQRAGILLWDLKGLRLKE